MYSVKSSSKKLLSIPLPISTSGVAINQAGSLLIGPNNANTGGSGRKNAVVVDFVIGNKELGESNRDAKVDSKV